MGLHSKSESVTFDQYVEAKVVLHKWYVKNSKLQGQNNVRKVENNLVEQQ